MKRYMILFLLLCQAFLFTACQKKEETPTEITFIHGWGSTESDHVAMRKIYEDFEKENPHIKLNMISMPSSTDVLNKVGDLLTVGEIPDIIFTAGDGRETIYEFMIEKDYALDLVPIMEVDKELQSSISPIAINYWKTKENQLFTVSDVLMMSGGYWYNKDVFLQAGIKEVPKTREAWLEACEKIKEYSEKNELNLLPILLDSNHVVYMTDAVLSEEDPGMLTSDRMTEIGDTELNPYGLGFRRTLMEMEKAAKISDVVNSFNYRDTLAAFNEGETAMYINGLWASSMISSKLNVGYAPLPTKDGKGVVAISSGVGYILGNTGNVEKIEASISFLKYMLSEEVAKRIVEETGQIPSNPKVEITKEVAGERLYQAIQSINSTERIIEVPANIWGTTKKDDYGNNIILYLDKKITITELQRRMME